MSKTSKMREQTPTAEDYIELLGMIDIMLQAFRDARTSIASEWHWWSMTNCKWNSFDEMWERVCAACSDFGQKGRHPLTYSFGATSRPSEYKSTVYYATCENGTEVEFHTTMLIAESAVKALLLFFTPGRDGLKLSDYLDGFVRARDRFKAKTGPAPCYAQWCWFEFVYSIGTEIGSPVRISSVEIPVVLDLSSGDSQLAQKEQFEA